MPLSGLQQYILKTCFGNKKIQVKGKFEKFYLTAKNPPAGTEQVKIISRSLYRLINKGYLAGYGEKTQYKWFINEIRLTSTGRKLAKKLLGEQRQLPFSAKGIKP